MMSLNGDLIADLLGRVDGVTLASLGCVSSQFWSIAKEEKIWEEKCSSLWPSTQDSDVKKFISSSLGGFRNFYASCFPIIAYDESFKRHKVKKVCDSLPSDFVSLVDVTYKDNIIYSKVVWGIPCAEEEFDTWFSNCPFKMELINFYDVEGEDQTSGDGLPKIDTIENVKKDLNFWGQMTENIRLSWIMVNKRTGQAANLSSWRPLCEQSDWASHKDCVISFGSILPAHNVLPCKSVQCILVLKCRLSDSLKITELSMRLEDTMGAWVNGRDSLLILERAVGCRRSNKQIQFFASYQKHLSERGKLKEANMKNEGCLDIICILGGIVVSASFWCLVFRESGPILEI
ncbi:hypothetical protein SUGI_1184440 [Cryptomeria japonica]|uniref:probable F-box protein At2g36090 isoform X1 n=1 Tax=Cryptomeria japonica TaxID=3369 RepID=UPI002414CDED|nr:probable F-box protein At2g36090 isoform X1 [Cryptomeria japonica]GLJ55195.1 hypothetical protein SUGI_1184440 [Cryptomeria japonica]